MKKRKKTYDVNYHLREISIKDKKEPREPLNKRIIYDSKYIKLLNKEIGNGRSV